MKHVKRIVGFVLALVMVLALSVGAFAAGNNTIKVTGAQAGETYRIYKMLDLSVNDDQTAFSYTVNSAWSNFFTALGEGAKYFAIDKQGYVTWKGDADDAASKEAFAKAAAKFAADNSVGEAAQAIKPENDGDITFTGLDSGYYLITSTNGTLAMVDTTPTKPDAEVQEKNPDSTIDKEVQEDSNNNWGSENSAQIGDTVHFRSTITIKKGAKNYVMHDKMDEGLTFTQGSVTIVKLTAGKDYTVESVSDGCTFEVHFKQSYLDTITEDTEIVVAYDAVLNEKAKVETPAENKAQLTWGDSSSTVWDSTETNTYAFSVLKFAASDADKSPLPDAEFQLKDAGGNVIKLVKITETEYRVANGDEDGAVESFFTVKSGKITIKGVDLDEYTLYEKTAPAGFNQLAEEVKVMVRADNLLTVEVANSTGTELPSTGGMGTTVFYILGSVLVLGAAVVLVTRKRMKEHN